MDIFLSLSFRLTLATKRQWHATRERENATTNEILGDIRNLRRNGRVVTQISHGTCFPAEDKAAIGNQAYAFP
jgi:hypothetical protein